MSHFVIIFPQGLLKQSWKYRYSFQQPENSVFYFKSHYFPCRFGWGLNLDLDFTGSVTFHISDFVNYGLVSSIECCLLFVHIIPSHTPRGELNGLETVTVCLSNPGLDTNIVYICVSM